MRKLLFALSALAALALLAPDSGIAQDYNQIGMYTVEAPDFAGAGLDTQTVYDGAPGQFTAYVVVSNPYNHKFCSGDAPDTTCTEQPVNNVGGFEFQLVWAPGLFVTPTIHPSATNFMTAPDFFCGANAQVIGGNVTVITLTIGVFTTDEALWYITPISDVPAQSIPGGIAITDADEVFDLVQAYPASGDFAEPVFAMWPLAGNRPVPNEDHTWGDVKTMFR